MCRMCDERGWEEGRENWEPLVLGPALAMLYRKEEEAALKC